MSSKYFYIYLFIVFSTTLVSTYYLRNAIESNFQELSKTSGLPIQRKN